MLCRSHKLLEREPLGRSLLSFLFKDTHTYLVICNLVNAIINQRNFKSLVEISIFVLQYKRYFITCIYYHTVYYFYQFLFLFSQFNFIIFGKRNKMERFFLKFMSYLSKKKKKKRFIFINRAIVPWIFPSSQKRKDFTYEYKEEEGEEKETWYKIKRFFNVYAI